MINVSITTTTGGLVIPLSFFLAFYFISAFFSASFSSNRELVFGFASLDWFGKYAHSLARIQTGNHQTIAFFI